jgi:hypothetical protein
LDIWGIKKIFGFYDRALEIIYNDEVIFKREKPESFTIGKSYFTELTDCDGECYTIIVNGKEIQIEEMALKNPPCPYFSNNLCTVGFPQTLEDFYRRSPLICATTPDTFIKNRNSHLVLMRKFCNCKSQKIPYTAERLRLDKIVLQRFYDFYVKNGLETDYTFLSLLENTKYPIKKE